MIRETKITIDFYSEILENDVSLLLNVKYELVLEGSVSSDGMYGKETDEVYDSVQFSSKDVNILNTRISYNVSKEFYDQFDSYEDDIKEAIENEINN